MADKPRAAPVPADPRFESRVRESFAEQGWMRTLGARLLTISPARVSIEMTPGPQFTQQHGYVHAGVVTSIADTACGYAALTLMQEGSDVLSVEFKVNLLAPALGPLVRADAHVVRSGRTLSVCQADVFAGKGGTRHVATMVATMMRIVPRGAGDGDD